MVSRHWQILVALAFMTVRTSVFGYGQDGHEIVGAIADELIKNTPAGKKIYALTDGITLRKAAFIPDEIKAWDKNGVDDPNAYPHYSDHPKIDSQLRDFWRANPPTPDPASPVPSHHWFHYTDVPILNVHKYSDGKTGRTQWDIVHMISYCVDVLRGEVPENNPRKITKSVAVILVAHYVGDIHQPLHVGAEYFNQAGQAVDPDANQPGTEDEGGNTIILRLTHGAPDSSGHKGGLKLHGYWDNDAVLANFPLISASASKEERIQTLKRDDKEMVAKLAKEQPANFREPSGVTLKKYPEMWADEILPIARKAHQRLHFVYMHPTVDQGRNVIAGDARENPPADGVFYADWAARTVRVELHKAGWRLADLLSQALEATPINSSAAIATPEPIVGSPEKNEETPRPAPTAEAQSNAAAPAPANPPPGSDFGRYPDNYKEVIVTWLRKYGLDASRIDWQSEPKPAEMPNGSGQRLSGYLVIFNTPSYEQMRTRSVLIRDGVVVVNNGF
ncbi:MAG TPA: S1/P1 nuclease [Chthoniobacterales bacterium]|nr:S1/P1 nuclease [Chthoniobacterales bacterium]